MAGRALDGALAELCASGLTEAIVVAHGGVLTDLLRNAMEDGRLDMLPDVSNIPNGSITRLRWAAEAIRIEAWADAEHL